MCFGLVKHLEFFFQQVITYITTVINQLSYNLARQDKKIGIKILQFNFNTVTVEGNLKGSELCKSFALSHLKVQFELFFDKLANFDEHQAMAQTSEDTLYLQKLYVTLDRQVGLKLSKMFLKCSQLLKKKKRGNRVPCKCLYMTWLHPQCKRKLLILRRGSKRLGALSLKP